MKYSEFHRKIIKRGKNRGWFWTGESAESHYIYEDKNGVRYPVPFHGAKEIGKGLQSKIEKDMELD